MNMDIRPTENFTAGLHDMYVLHCTCLKKTEAHDRLIIVTWRNTCTKRFFNSSILETIRYFKHCAQGRRHGFESGGYKL